MCMQWANSCLVHTCLQDCHSSPTSVFLFTDSLAQYFGDLCCQSISKSTPPYDLSCGYMTLDYIMRREGGAIFERAMKRNHIIFLSIIPLPCCPFHIRNWETWLQIVRCLGTTLFRLRKSSHTSLKHHYDLFTGYVRRRIKTRGKTFSYYFNIV